MFVIVVLLCDCGFGFVGCSYLGLWCARVVSFWWEVGSVVDLNVGVQLRVFVFVLFRC